jgi:cell division protein FtsB
MIGKPTLGQEIESLKNDVEKLKRNNKSLRKQVKAILDYLERQRLIEIYGLED